MTRTGVFPRDTKLWHPTEGWKVFPQGEQDPGLAWSEKEGGDVPAEVDVSELKARTEKAEDLLKRRQADIDRVAQERDDANTKIAGLERRAGEAEKALAEAQADKLRYAEDRDRAIQNEAAMRRELEAAKARIRELEADLESVGATTAEDRSALKSKPAGKAKAGL